MPALAGQAEQGRKPRLFSLCPFARTRRNPPGTCLKSARFCAGCAPLVSSLAPRGNEKRQPARLAHPRRVGRRGRLLCACRPAVRLFCFRVATGLPARPGDSRRGCSHRDFASARMGACTGSESAVKRSLRLDFPFGARPAVFASVPAIPPFHRFACCLPVARRPPVFSALHPGGVSHLDTRFCLLNMQ